VNEPRGFNGPNEALHRRYNIENDPVSTFASDCFPTVSISDDEMDYANRFLAGIKSCGARTAAGPPAGQLGAIGVRNPAGSNVLVTIERVLISSSVACNVSAYFDPSNAVTPSATASVVLLDSRWLTDRSSSLGVVDARVGGVSGVLGATRLFGELQFGAAITIEYPVVGVVLTPGSQLFLESNNTTGGLLWGAWRWRERGMVVTETGG